MIPSQFHNPDFRFADVVGRSKGPERKGWPLNPLTLDQAEEWIAKGNNYGIVSGYGNLIAIDFDHPDLLRAVEYSGLSETLTTQTPSGMFHKWYIAETEFPWSKKYYPLRRLATSSDTESEQECGFVHLGELRVNQVQTVGPGSFTKDGEYIVYDDKPIAQTKQQDVLDLLKDYISIKDDDKKISVHSDYEHNFSIMTVIEKAKIDMKQSSNGEFYGSHPMHGSDTKKNFWVNPHENEWHCFRHGTGGGPFQLIAVLNKIITCEGSVTEGLVGEDFKKVLEIAKKQYGYIPPGEIEHVVTIPLTSSSDFWSKEIPPIEFIVDPFLQLGGRTVLAGPPGCCKTMFAMNLAGVLASKKEDLFLEKFKIKPCRVLYVDLENGPVTLQHRFKKMFKDPPENLYIHGYASFNLANEHCKAELKGIIDEVRPDAVIIDPLSSLIHSNMFTQEEVVPFKTFFDNIRAEYNSSLFFIHHWRKATRDSRDGQEMLAGSFTLNAWLENQISLNNIKGLLTLKSQKSRNSMHFDPMSLSLSNDTLQLKFLQLFDSKYGEDDIDRAFEAIGGSVIDKKILLKWMEENNGPKTWKTLEGKINESSKYHIDVKGKGRQAKTTVLRKQVQSESFLDPAPELEWE